MPKKEDSESESLLLHKDAGSYTDEDAVVGVSGDLREMDYVDTDVSVLSQFHEDALAQAGHGCFQYLLFFVLGLCLAADAIEIFVISYLLPSAEKDLCMDDKRKGWMAAVTFLGMMVGGLVWGTMADKLGRRRTLISAIMTNAVFSSATAFMPTYGLFLITRLLSGIGVGGSLPIVFTYYSEFLVKRHRGRHLSWLLTCWGIGGLYTAIVAYLLMMANAVPEEPRVDTPMQFWRPFLIICSIPSIIGTFSLFFLPESPRYLLECGRDVEAMYVYQKVFRFNHKNTDEYQLSEMEMPSRQSPNAGLTGASGCLADFLEAFETFWGSFMQIFWPPYTKVTCILLLVWMTTAFGFYGMSIWFPEYVRKLAEREYDKGTEVFANSTAAHRRFTGSLDNKRFENITFLGDRFEKLILNHCTFVDCHFQNCTFEHLHTSKSYFVHSTFRGVIFEKTDLYDYRFIDCTFRNSSFRHTIQDCPVDLDYNNNLTDVFTQNIIAQMAIIPGNIFSSFVLDRFGRVKTMATSLFLTSVSLFFIWFLDTRNTVIAFEALFNFISVSGWNAVDVITTESYPASLRSTGYGFLSAASRLASVLGNLSFAHFISIDKAVPILTTASVIMVGAIASLKLTETKDVLL